MEDVELKLILKKILFTFIIVIIIISPLIFYVYNKFDNGTSDLISKINNEDKVLFFITSNNCNKCDKIETVLKQSNVKYEVINIDKNNNYIILLNRIKLNEEYAPAPSLIYIENGKLDTNIYEFDEVDLDEFFKEKKLYKEEK